MSRFEDRLAIRLKTDPEFAAGYKEMGDEIIACDIPQYADVLRVSASVNLDWRERLLLLFRPLCIEVSVACEVSPGRTKGATEAWAARWRWPWQHNGAREATLPRDADT